LVFDASTRLFRGSFFDIFLAAFVQFNLIDAGFFFTLLLIVRFKVGIVEIDLDDLLDTSCACSLQKNRFTYAGLNVNILLEFNV
jgi:hypothetical protein